MGDKPPTSFFKTIPARYCSKSRTRCRSPDNRTASPAFAKQRPQAVRGFVKATIQSWQSAAAEPDAAIAALKRAEPLSDPAVELTRLKWALEFVVTPGVRQTGIGDVDPARLAKHITIVTDGFGLPRKLAPETVFDSSFLPPVAERRTGR